MPNTQLPFSFDDLPSIPVDPSGTVILLLTRSRLGEQRSLRRMLKLDASLETSVDKSFLSMMARLYSSPELKAIERLDSSVTANLSRIALPSILRTGSTWVLPIPLIPRVDQLLEERSATRTALVETLVAAFDRRSDETRAKLGPIADQLTWLTSAQVRACFAMSWRYYSIGLPASLENFDPLLYEREKSRMLADLSEQSLLIQGALAEGAMRLLARLESNLSPGADGRAGRLYDSAVENVREFLELLPARTIVDTPAFTALMDQARTVIGPLSVEELRRSPETRTSVLTSITSVIDGLVDATGVSRPSRRIRFEDDEPDTPTLAEQASMAPTPTEMGPGDGWAEIAEQAAAKEAFAAAFDSVARPVPTEADVEAMLEGAARVSPSPLKEEDVLLPFDLLEMEGDAEARLLDIETDDLPDED